MTDLNNTTMRTCISLFVATIAITSLVSCSTESPSGDNGAAAAPCTSPGQQSKDVRVEGPFGGQLTTTFPKPLSATTTERSVVIEGTGPQLQQGEFATLRYVVYDGNSGEVIYDSEPNGAPRTLRFDQQLDAGLLKTLTCSTVGSRVVSVIPPSESSVGSSGEQTPTGASQVFVIDIEGAAPAQANGEARIAQQGFPTVSINETTGKPTVTIPSEPAPSELKEAVLIQGSGSPVGEGDTVTVQYQGLVWGTGQVFEDSWGREGTTFSTNNVIKGLSQGLVGQAVGSRVVIVVPPNLAYGSGGDPATGISGTDTLVFVVDILATQSGG